MKNFRLLKFNQDQKNISLIIIAFFWIFFGFNGALQYLLPLLALKNLKALALVSQIILYTVFLITSVFSVQITNKVGLKRSVILGVIFYCLYIISLITLKPIYIYLGSSLIGVGATLLWVASTKIITDYSQAEEVGKYLGIQYASFLLGTLGGTFLGGVLVTRVSFTSLYLIFSAFILISIPFLKLLQIHESKIKQISFSPSYLWEKNVLLIFPIAYASAFVLSQTFNAMNLVILDLFDFSMVGKLSTLTRIVMVAGSLLLGKLADRVNKISLLFILITSGLVGLLSFLLTHRLLIIISGVILIGVFISATYATCLALLKQRLSEEKYAYAIGAFQVYITLAVLSAIISTLLLPPRLSFMPGIIALCISFVSLKYLAKTEKSLL